MKIVRAEGCPADFIKVSEIEGDMGEVERMALLQEPDGDVVVTFYDTTKKYSGKSKPDLLSDSCTHCFLQKRCQVKQEVVLR